MNEHKKNIENDSYNNEEKKYVIRSHRRRTIFFTLSFLISSLTTLLMADLLWRIGFDVAKVILLILFFVLFTQITFGGLHGVFGLFTRKKRKFFDHITETIAVKYEDIPLAPTAIAIPVYNEDATRVFEGIRTIYKSLEKTGSISSFDFFILSDTTNPDRAIQEESSWIELCQQLNALGRIYYRRRTNNFNKKAGNIADFCRTWGKNYRYMVCLDADSIVSGHCVTSLVKIMEKNPRIGICQTAPHIVCGESLFGRLMQFASNFYGPIFQAGLNYWQQENGNFWGHNAVIRIKPFMELCGLPRLPGKEPFGGKILSHDFVEASLMRKGGWSVWLAYDIPGSYEEGPPDIIETAKRDRRWSQGNLQHTWLMLSKGTPFVNRIHMLNGIMSYLGSFLWLIFLLISTLIVYQQYRSGLSVITVNSFANFINFSVTQEGLLIFFITMVVLFIPKICSVLKIFCAPRKAVLFGGYISILISVFMEMLFSALMAPVLMIFHSQFIIYIFIGKGASWGPQKRSAKDGIALSNAIRVLAPHTIIGLAWAIFAFWSSITFFWWLSPIFISLILSIPVSIFMSKVSTGQRFKDLKIFLTPSETSPPEELTFLEESLEKQSFSFPTVETKQDHPGLLKLIVDPYINAIHITLISEPENEDSEISSEDQLLAEKLLTSGPDILSAPEIKKISNDSNILKWLHAQVWLRPSDKLHKSWQETIFST